MCPEPEGTSGANNLFATNETATDKAYLAIMPPIPPPVTAPTITGTAAAIKFPFYTLIEILYSSIY